MVDKPAGMTSHDVVAKVRKLAGTRKVGHAGTLDPMATGLLVLGFESATKLLTFVVGAEKTYLATLRLGASTITDDREGEFIEQASPAQLSSISNELITAELSKLRGVIQQVPSAVSAIKVNGERAYDRVRAGEVFELKSREVIISKLEVIGQIRREENYIDIDIIVDCSSGTYIRAIARDLGAALGVGGHLTQLRRTRIGAFDVSDALVLNGTSTQAIPIIRSVDAVKFLMPVIECNADQALAIRQGKRIIGEVDQVAALIGSGELIAVVESAGPKNLKSLVVFNDGDSNG